MAAAILDLDWYKWDLTNQKMYLILITNVTKLMKVSLIVIIDVDHELLKKV